MNFKNRLSVACMAMLCLLFSVSPTMAQRKFTISGKLSENISGKIFLVHRLNGQDVSDSTALNKGSFTFNGEISSPYVARLIINPLKVNYVTSIIDYKDFFLDPGTTTVLSTDSLHEATVKGGKSQEDFLAIDAIHRPLVTQMNGMRPEIMKAREAKDDEALKAINTKGISISNLSKKADSTFIATNPNSFVAFFIWSHAHRGMVNETVEKEFRKFNSAIQRSAEGLIFEKKIQNSKRLEAGQIAPDISLPDMDGKMVSLSSLKGKNILLVFWASNFGVFNEFTFNLANVYRQLKDKNLVVYAVNYEDKSLWKEVIEENAMDYINVTDEGGISNSVNGDGDLSVAAKAYGLTSKSELLTAFLIGPDGKILAKRVRLSDPNVPQIVSKLIK